MIHLLLLFLSSDFAVSQTNSTDFAEVVAPKSELTTGSYNIPGLSLDSFSYGRFQLQRLSLQTTDSGRLKLEFHLPEDLVGKGSAQAKVELTETSRSSNGFIALGGSLADAECVLAKNHSFFCLIRHNAEHMASFNLKAIEDHLDAKYVNKGEMKSRLAVAQRFIQDPTGFIVVEDAAPLR
jgi:hypothetical protein